MSKHKLLRWLAVGWPFVLPVLLLAPGMAGFIYPGSGALHSDAAVTHYPSALFLQRSLQAGEVPLWSPQIFSGYPFVAHPYSGLWYPPYWLALLLPLPLGLNLLVAAHLLMAGVGMYAFLRQQGLGRLAAVLGGLAFQCAPRLFAHIGAGHLMLVMAVCLTPWLLWASGQRRLPAGMLLALILAADPRWALYATALWAVWQISHRRIKPLLQQGVLAGLLALPALAGYVQLGMHSSRAHLQAAEVLELSLPPSQLLGLLLPQWGAAHEWVVYPGAVLLALVLLARPWLQGGRVWLLVALGSLVLALGSYIPGMSALAQLPGFSQLRVPPRALLLVAFAGAVLVARSLHYLQSLQNLQRWQRLLLAAFLALCSVFAVLAVSQQAALWLPAVLTAVLLALAWWALARLGAPTRQLALATLVLLDLALASTSLLRFRPASEVLAEGQTVAAFLAAQPGRFRVFAPDYSLPQHTAALYGLEMASGVDPLQIDSYARYLQAASGLPQGEYSVALPPPGAALELDAAVLGRLNVEYIVSAQPLRADGLLQLRAAPYIYANEYIRPRAWVQQSSGEIVAAETIELRANQITLQASGPGTLYLAEVQYPGWQVVVDGAASEFTPAEPLLRAVELTPGQHTVELRFAPAWLLPTMVLAAVGWLLCLGSLLRRSA